MAATTVKLAPFKPYVGSGVDLRHFRDMEVNVVFTPDASRYVVRGQYTPVWGSCYSQPTYMFELVDNFGQIYRLSENAVEVLDRPRIIYDLRGEKHFTLELHTIDGDDTREHYKTQPIERRGYYAPLPADIIDEIKTSVDTTGSSFGYAFTPALMRAYANARSAAALRERDDRIAALEARVKELEALIAAPKPDTAAVSLLELEDFFGAPSDADIGNLPEFIHDAE